MREAYVLGAGAKSPLAVGKAKPRGTFPKKVRRQMSHIQWLRLGVGA
jgi:hypothetical protein